MIKGYPMLLEKMLYRRLLTLASLSTGCVVYMQLRMIQNLLTYYLKHNTLKC